MSELLVRSSRPGDVDAITAIYAWHVEHGTGTFELEPPGREEMAKRWAALVDTGRPWIVLERASRILGYASASQFRPRPGYRFCVEDSIYLAPDACGQGYGRILLAELLARCESAGVRQVLAVIGDSANAGSVGVHRALGFTQVGALAGAGWKFDRWLDVVLMQKSLGAGRSLPPA